MLITPTGSEILSDIEVEWELRITIFLDGALLYMPGGVGWS